MARRNVLLVTTVVADDDELHKTLSGAAGMDDANVRIVAPAARISKLDWLANADDDARQEARRAAEQAAGALGADTTVEVDRTSHDTDAAQAVADALRNFPADEIVVVTRPGDDSSWLEDETVRAALEDFGVPVRRVELAAE
jgi:hypothetical protein